MIPKNGKEKRDGYAVITGGAGFVGVNVAQRLLAQGTVVRIFDNLSRPGVERNLQWLVGDHGERVSVMVEDIRDAPAVRKAVHDAHQVFHFAAQVAVTTSIQDPVRDFEINVGGTLNLLEALRALKNPPPLLFTSTNKVYGGLENLALREEATRYAPVDGSIAEYGIPESTPLIFHSPYGCSKGAADQYVLDYARMYGIPAVVFRMSCIYGPRQFGTEDQGWLAHFLIRALENRSITLYGDGKQVRDILFVDDLVDAMQLAICNIDRLWGRAFNIGGGPSQTTSLLEIVDLIEDLHGYRPAVRFDTWRPGDQRYYVSDIRNFSNLTGWAPQVGVREGVARLSRWLKELRSEKPASLVA